MLTSARNVRSHHRFTFPCLVAAVALLAAAAQAVPVSTWQLNEPVGTVGAGSVIDSVGGFNGTPVGTVTFGAQSANPNTGTGISLAGTGVINVPYTAATNPASFTVAGWAKVNNFTSGGYRSLLTSRDDPGSGASLGGGVEGYIIYANPTNNWEFWTGTGGGPGTWNVLGGGAVTEGVWTHLAISYDAGTSTKSFYVNGALAGSNVSAYVPNNGEQLHIGGGADDGTSFRFNGLIDDVRVFNNALSLAEIQAVAQGGPSKNISAGKTYAYTVLPQFSGGTFYFDDPHVQVANAFSTGELTDGVTFPSAGTPTVPAVNALSGWGVPETVGTEITFDLGSVMDIDRVRLGTFTYAPFANGAPNDVLVSFSTTGTAPGDFGGAVFQAFTAPPANGHWDLDVNLSGVTAARYVKLTFDGGALLTGGTANKWMLDEVTIFGQAIIPEPGTASLLLIAAAGLVRRRRAA